MKCIPQLNSSNTGRSGTQTPKKQPSKRKKRKSKLGQFRKKHKIRIKGSYVPHPVASFAELYSLYNVPEYIQSAIKSIGYKDPTAIQMQLIPTLLHSREVFACAPTGSGKTAAFLIPLLTNLHKQLQLSGQNISDKAGQMATGFIVLIVAPTRELTMQIYRNLILISKHKYWKILLAVDGTKNLREKLKSNLYQILLSTPDVLVKPLRENILDLSSYVML